jgi:DNA polymerase-3 subunit epsilon/ATP-dependent DNA helicase DinG
MTSIVVLDLETTGLDADRDTIIEVGAVRINGKRVEDEFSTLINPGRHIPEFITNLTGIDDAMVRQAPRLREISQELESFVGDLPVAGHNVRFDAGFLQKAGLLQFNELIDTYELAAILMPSASRYGLGALGQQLGIPHRDAAHRALSDAQLTKDVYLRLLDLAAELPLETLAEILRLSEPLTWNAAWPLRQVLRARSKEGIQPRKARAAGKKQALAPEMRDYPPLQNPENPTALDPEDVSSILEYGGPFSKYFESYEHRPEQVAMLQAVTNALSCGTHLMVEAGTGVGKSFAYLIPAALFAMQNNTRVVISTNTINLQDQLIKKDIPDLRAALGLDLRAAVLKGRSNYLCPRRFQYMRQHGPATEDELRVMAKILVWQLHSLSGDRNEITLTGPSEREVWDRLSAEDDNCTNETCLGRMNGVCPFYRAKQAAQSAHVLVVNHALLLSDVAAGGKVLPDYNYVIVDEGHHIESATTSALSFRLTQFDMERLTRELGGSSAGVLGRMLTEVRESMRPGDFALLQQKVKRSTDQAFRLEQLIRQFFTVLAEFTARQREGQPASMYAWQLRIIPAIRTLQEWEEVEMMWGEAGETMVLLLKSLGELYKDIASLYSDGHENLEEVMSTLGNLIRRMTEAEAAANGLISKPNADQIYWVEANPRGDRLSLNAAPLRVGPLVEKYLWHEKACVVLTSATLTAHGEFQYVRNTLSADEADELTLGSPFDYESSTLLYIANDLPEPNGAGYQQAVDRSIVQLARATGGRMLVLFTSYTALKKTSQAITSVLAHDDIYVFEQGEGASPNALLESFRSTERAVLLGTRAFWEGVDVPGAALSVVVLTKLPFDVPSDPLIAARSELYEDPFSEYYLPEAILKFRQGFGRLIRTASDRGVVAIFDRRVLSKQYGRLFLESLPQCTTRQGPASDLPRMASQWLGM